MAHTANPISTEIAIEVAWQLGDFLQQEPRAESRWKCAEITERIVSSGIITEHSDDIDEIIQKWLLENDYD